MDEGASALAGAIVGVVGTVVVTSMERLRFGRTARRIVRARALSALVIVETMLAAKTSTVLSGDDTLRPLRALVAITDDREVVAALSDHTVLSLLHADLTASRFLNLSDPLPEPIAYGALYTLRSLLTSVLKSTGGSRIAAKIGPLATEAVAEAERYRAKKD